MPERTKAKAEVYFVIEKGKNLIPIEVKLTDKLSKGLRSFIKTYKPERAFVVLYKGKEREIKIDGCKVIFTDIFGLRECLI